MTIEEYIDGMKRYFSTTSKPNGRHSVDDCCNYNILCSACIFHNYCAPGELTLAEKAEILEKWLKEHPIITNRQHFIDEFGFDGYTCNRTCNRTLNSNNDCDICPHGRYAEYKKPEKNTLED